MKLVLQNGLCDVLLFANFLSEFYYNFITTELGKLKIFEQFCPPKELFFSSKLDAFLFESESEFSEKWFIFTSKCNNT